jgi:transposase
MRYELTDFEWAAIKSFLPNKPTLRVEQRER